MREDEYETLAIMIEYLESAKAIAQEKLKYYISNKIYDKVFIFQGLIKRFDIGIEIIKDCIAKESKHETR